MHSCTEKSEQGPGGCWHIAGDGGQETIMGIFAASTPAAPTLTVAEQADVLFDEMRALAKMLEDLSMEAYEVRDYICIRYIEKTLQKKQAKRAALLGWTF